MARSFVWMADDFRAYDESFTPRPHIFEDKRWLAVLDSAVPESAINQVQAGCRIDQEPRFIFEVEPQSDLPPPDLLTTHNYLYVISRKFVRLLQSRDILEVQFVPVTIVDNSGRHLPHEYFLANWLNIVDCMCRRKSVIHRDDDPESPFPRFGRCVIDPLRIPQSLSAVRILGDIEVLLLTEELQAAIQQAGMVGPMFQRIENVPRCADEE